MDERERERKSRAHAIINSLSESFYKREENKDSGERCALYCSRDFLSAAATSFVEYFRVVVNDWSNQRFVNF